jgi:hypothetical protein
LAARINDLQTKHGYVFKEEKRGGDYVYTLVSTPQTTLGLTEAQRKVALFDAGAPAEQIFAV